MKPRARSSLSPTNPVGRRVFNTGFTIFSIGTQFALLQTMGQPAKAIEIDAAKPHNRANNKKPR